MRADASGNVHLQKEHVGLGFGVIAGEVTEVKATQTVGNQNASVSGTAGIAAPGSVGIGADAEATLHHGKLTVGGGGMGDVEFGGVQLHASFTVNTAPIVHVGEHVAHSVEHAAGHVGHVATGAGNHALHGAHDAAHAVTHGATGAAQTVSHAASNAGHAVEHGAKDVGHKISHGLHLPHKHH